MKATWNNTVLADSDDTIVIEGNHYFPPESVNMDLMKKSEKTSVCPWKGTANYYDIAVESQTNPGAAWYYPQPKDAAKEIAGYVAFWNGVQVD